MVNNIPVLGELDINFRWRAWIHSFDGFGKLDCEQVPIYNKECGIILII